MAATTILRTVIEATGLSRRRAFEAIRGGRLTVGGWPATDPSAPYEGGELALDGQPLGVSAAAKIYLVMNKPADVLSALSDARGRTTILDVVPAGLRARGLHPVGRLDRDSTGLLILTNDGDLTYRLTHPKHQVEKEYWLATEQGLDAEQLSSLQDGIELDGEVRRPVAVRRLRGHPPFEASIVIREGRYRQVRRMVQAVGGQVKLLRRVREGSLRLGDLPSGAVRRLSAEELRALLTEGTDEDA